ncbi:MAG: 3-dehydroquinate synthase [Candidatus Eisenbacteria bacterium]|nr:3-dehydroquinate synthase [Candidatus Eisenbacteria bacterium]
MRTVRVRLGERSYPVRIGAGLLDEAGRALRDAGLEGPVLLLSDARVDGLYGDRLRRSLRAARLAPRTLLVRSGERSKTPRTASRIWGALAREEGNRSRTIVALGGGILIDLAGFVAALWRRGIPWATIPTTLLAQADASVGGKTAVNLPEGKNLVGVFHQPRAVLIDPDMLATLPARDFRAGFGEVIKTAVAADRGLFAILERDAESLLGRDPEALARVLERSVRRKAERVTADERDRTGVRAALNLGHTFAHALETGGGYRYRHGEAVALGLVAATALSARLGLLAEEERRRVVLLIRRFGLPTGGVPLDPGILLPLTRRDKKRVGNRVGFVLTKSIGFATFPQSVADSPVLRAFREICSSPRVDESGN